MTNINQSIIDDEKLKDEYFRLFKKAVVENRVDDIGAISNSVVFKFAELVAELTLKRNGGEAVSSTRLDKNSNLFNKWWGSLNDACREKFNKSDAMSAFFAGLNFNDLVKEKHIAYEIEILPTKELAGCTFLTYDKNEVYEKLYKDEIGRVQDFIVRKMYTAPPQPQTVPKQEAQGSELKSALFKIREISYSCKQDVKDINTIYMIAKTALASAPNSNTRLPSDKSKGE